MELIVEVISINFPVILCNPYREYQNSRNEETNLLMNLLYAENVTISGDSIVYEQKVYENEPFDGIDVLLLLAFGFIFFFGLKTLFKLVKLSKGVCDTYGMPHKTTNEKVKRVENLFQHLMTCSSGIRCPRNDCLLFKLIFHDNFFVYKNKNNSNSNSKRSDDINNDVKDGKVGDNDSNSGNGSDSSSDNGTESGSDSASASDSDTDSSRHNKNNDNVGNVKNGKVDDNDIGSNGSSNSNSGSDIAVPKDSDSDSSSDSDSDRRNCEITVKCNSSNSEDSYSKLFDLTNCCEPITLKTATPEKQTSESTNEERKSYSDRFGEWPPMCKTRFTDFVSMLYESHSYDWEQPDTFMVLELENVTGLRCTEIQRWFRNKQEENIKVKPEVVASCGRSVQLASIDIKNCGECQNKVCNISVDDHPPAKALFEFLFKSTNWKHPTDHMLKVVKEVTGRRFRVLREIFNQMRKDDDFQKLTGTVNASGKIISYTPYQTSELEKEFQVTKYPTPYQCMEIAQDLCLSEGQVKIWFQNKRKKYFEDYLRGKMSNAGTSGSGMSVAITSDARMSSGTTLADEVKNILPKDESLFFLVESQPNPPGTVNGHCEKTFYTVHQTLKLEKEFRVNCYLTRSRSMELSNILGLTRRQILIWFENRRKKYKDENSVVKLNNEA